MFFRGRRSPLAETCTRMRNARARLECFCRSGEVSSSRALRKLVFFLFRLLLCTGLSSRGSRRSRLIGWLSTCKFKVELRWVYTEGKTRCCSLDFQLSLRNYFLCTTSQRHVSIFQLHKLYFYVNAYPNTLR